MNAMRETGTPALGVHHSSRKNWLGALRLTAVVVGIGVVMTAGIARAQDADESDDSSFEDKIIKGIMTGIGATNMENRGIDYRERSPLVVPPKLDLGAPAADAAEVKAPNWPKDPDEQRTFSAIAARKKANKDPPEASRILTPSERSHTFGKNIFSG